jgi:hypothetical protein
MEILYGPPGRVRLPINDDEIVDRALAAGPLAGKSVTLVTFDTGQTFRAREADLPVVKLSGIEEVDHIRLLRPQPLDELERLPGQRMEPVRHPHPARRRLITRTIRD